MLKNIRRVVAGLLMVCLLLGAGFATLAQPASPATDVSVDSELQVLCGPHFPPPPPPGGGDYHSVGTGG
jgi:hypothetical protein